MELTRLRKIRDDLIPDLLKFENDEFEAIEIDLLEDCITGKNRARIRFMSQFFVVPEDDIDDDDAEREWATFAHKEFFNLCMKIEALEQKTYMEAFV